MFYFYTFIYTSPPPPLPLHEVGRSGAGRRDDAVTARRRAAGAQALCKLNE